MNRELHFLDLKALHAPLVEQLVASFQRVLDAGSFILGDELRAFESAFAEYCGTRHCIGTGSGLDALTLTLRAAGIGPGDEVIVPAQTFVATWMAVSNAGATPVGADIDPVSHNIAPAAIEAAISPRTRAIIPVHLYGHPAEMTSILALAERHGLFVLEDAAQAHGARYQGRPVGSLGDAAAFSFYPGKNLGALGDGGAITTDDDALAERLRRLRNYGSARKYEHREIGFNARLDELQAALLRAKLPYLESWNRRRSEIAEQYLDQLSGHALDLPPAADAICQPVWHQFVITVDNRDSLQQRLAENGIPTMVHYPLPPHQQAAYTACPQRVPFPVAEAQARRCLSLPISPTLSNDDVNWIVSAIGIALNETNRQPDTP